MNKLIVERIIDYYDIPQLFVAKDVIGTRYLCLFVENNDISLKYMSTKISSDRLYELESGKIDLRIIFEKPEIDEFYIIEFDNTAEETFLFEIYHDKIEHFLPEKDLYLTKTNVDNLLRKIAIDQNQNIYQLHLVEQGKKNSASANLLSDYVRIIQKLIKNSINQASKKLKIEVRKRLTDFKATNMDVFAFSEGSLNIYFKTNSYVDMFGYSDDQVFINKLTELIAFDILEKEKMQTVFRDNKGHVISTMHALCKKIIENNVPLEIYYSSPNGKDEGIIEIDVIRAKVYSDFIDSKVELKDEEVFFDGIFMQADVEKGNWRLKLNDDHKEINGKSNAGILSGVVLETKSYKVHCKETITEESATGEEKKHYDLIDYV